MLRMRSTTGGMSFLFSSLDRNWNNSYFFQVTVLLNATEMTVQAFLDKVLKGALNMLSPDVMVDDGKGTVLISSEEDETEDNMNKVLSVRYVNS